MKQFARARESGEQYADVKPTSVKGTPLGKGGEAFSEFMQDVAGYEPGADGYVYVLVLRRQTDDTRWYYVGEVTGDETRLKSRIDTHLRCKMSKPITRDGLEVIDYRVPGGPDHPYEVIGVERVESVSVDTDLLEGRLAERERALAYELSIEKETTRILGGK